MSELIFSGMLRRSSRKRSAPTRLEEREPRVSRPITTITNTSGDESFHMPASATQSGGFITTASRHLVVPNITPSSSANTGTTVGPAFPVSNVSLTSGSSQLVLVINSDSVNEGNYLLPNNPVLCSKASDDLALNVSPNLRQKRIAGEYVDLANLLINSQATQSEGQKLVFVNGEIVVEQKSKNKIYNIESWTDAFLIFSSIYGAAHPESYPDLLKYMNVMCLGAKRSQGWNNYDEQYRLRKAQDPSSSWATIDQELWLLYLYSAPGGSNVQPSSSSHKCYNYNYQGSCTKLYYRNECGRFGALKSDSTHHFFRNACTKSGSLWFSQFSGC